MTTPRFSTLLLLVSLLWANEAETTNEFYCGKDWPDAFANCHKACPSGQDSDCSSLGLEFKCYGYTGCAEKLNDATVDPGDGGGGSGASVADGAAESASDYYCGISWTEAMVSCSVQCPTGGDDECPGGQKCFAAANCNEPLITLTSNLVVTMEGPSSVMDAADGEVFGMTMDEIITQVADGEGLHLRGVNLGEQSVFSSRKLAVNNITAIGQRRLPLGGSSALDVSVVVTGEYRPPPYLDLDVICDTSINKNPQMVVSTLRVRGSRAGSDFFQRVEGISSVVQKEYTARPSRGPTKMPTTEKPTPGPTAKPTTAEPSVEPSSFPSSEPSRAMIQSIVTGSRQDLLIGGATTSSYGYLFNVRTKTNSPVVVITGMDFYTYSTEKINFELWSRIGNFQNHKGSMDGWELVSKGSVTGRGTGRYSSIPSSMFTPVDIPGGGEESGTRAFYLTLDSVDLVYKIAQGSASDGMVQVDTEEIEVWEGEGVLLYPMPDVSRVQYYRYPRQFLGAIHYDRLPCKPYSAFGKVFELPCPDMPTQSPTVPAPTFSPVIPTQPPSPAPISNTIASPSPFAPVSVTDDPTVHPSFAPTSSAMPSFAPSSSQPTFSPIVLMRANVMITLRNVPERVMEERELKKFMNITLAFLQRHTEQTMALDDMDIWHQQIVLVDALSTDSTENIADKRADGFTQPNNRSRRTKGDSSAGKGSYNAVDQSKIQQILEFKQNYQARNPKTTGLQITTILRISFSFLPENLLAKMAAVSMEEHSMELIRALRNESSFYSYFQNVDGISSDHLLELTKPPTIMPTTYDFLAKQEEEAILVSEEGSFATTFGIAILFLWCFLTGISILCLLKARSEMKEQLKMEELLRQESNKPLMIDQQTPAVPMGAEDTTINILDVSSYTNQTAKMKASVIQKGTVHQEHASQDQQLIDTINSSLFGIEDAQSTALSTKTHRPRRKLSSENEQLIGSINSTLFATETPAVVQRQDSDDAKSTAASIKTSSSGKRKECSRNSIRKEPADDPHTVGSFFGTGLQIVSEEFDTSVLPRDSHDAKSTATCRNTGAREKRKGSSHKSTRKESSALPTADEEASTASTIQRRDNEDAKSTGELRKTNNPGKRKGVERKSVRESTSDGPHTADLLFGTAFSSALPTLDEEAKSFASERRKGTTHRHKNHQTRKSRKSDQRKSLRSDKVTSADTASFLFI